jgi:hypothetical protein
MHTKLIQNNIQYHTDYHEIITEWVFSLLNQNIRTDFLDLDFTKEDGMNLDTYLQFELTEYQKLAPLSDLHSSNFFIEIIHYQPLKNKTIIYFLIRNHLNKIVCRTNITFNENKKITGNDFYTHLSPKFIIQNEYLHSIGFSVKSSEHISEIISPNLELEYFSKGISFEQDGFYIASFIGTFNSKSLFYFKFADKIEKREVFFGTPNLQCKPYKIIGDNIHLCDNYPLHINYTSNNLNIDIENPRNLIISTSNAIITDCLDNDWIIN